MIKVEINHLKECLDYNYKTGGLFWKHRPEHHFKNNLVFKAWNTRYANKKAGCTGANGYVYISVDKKRYLAHRLGYALYHGYFPENDIDHKDRIRTHNWITNLREASDQCNLRNAGMSKNNTSGVKGVNFDKPTKKWRAKIMIFHKTISIGRFKLFSDAVKASWGAEVKYKFPNCCADSSSYNYLKQHNVK